MLLLIFRDNWIIKGLVIKGINKTFDATLEEKIIFLLIV